MKKNNLGILVVLGLVGCLGSPPGPTATVLATSTRPQTESMMTPLVTEEPTTVPSPVASLPRPSQTMTASPLHPTPLALDSETISDGTILYTPDSSDPEAYAVVYQYQNNGEDPEPFLSVPECCLFYWISGDQMMSPDHRYAAILKEDRTTSSGGKSLIVTDGSQQWIADMDELQARDIAYWPSNSEVFLYPAGDEHQGGNLLLYNPFSQEIKRITPTFPNLINGVINRVPIWYSAPDAPKYDPSLSLVVYYHLGDLDWAISLWDLNANSEVWRRKLMSMTARPWSSEPVWSPDGSHFAIFLPDALEHKTLELVLVDRSGQETTLLEPALSRTITWGSGIAWSPDGRYLSFYIQDQEGVRPLVYDLKHKQIWDPLLIEYTKEEMVYNPGGVIWSPDSKQLLVRNLVVRTSKDFSYLVDVQKHQTFDFGNLFATAVWLAPYE